MGKKKKNKGKPEAALTATASAPEAAGGPRPGGAVAAVRPPEKTLMETLPNDTTPAQMLMLIAILVSIPTVLSLLVKYVVLPAFFPHW